MSSMRRTNQATLLTLAATGVMATGLWLTAPTATAHGGHGGGDHGGEPATHIPLPDGFRPEGIATGPRHTAYLGSLADGDIYALDLRTGEGEVISEGPGTPSVGLKLDRTTGCSCPAAPPATPGWSTPAPAKSWRPTRSRPPARRRSSTTWSSPTRRRGSPTRSTTRCTGSRSAATATARCPTPGRRREGRPHRRLGPEHRQQRQRHHHHAGPPGAAGRSTPATGCSTASTTTASATQVDLGGYVVTNGDGLLREGRTLYAVQNRLNQVAVFKLSQERHQRRAARHAHLARLRRADHDRAVRRRPLPAERAVHDAAHARPRRTG